MKTTYKDQTINVLFVQNFDDAQYTTLCCCYTSAHPSPCCCCSMMTASSALLSPLISRNCKRLSTLFEYLQTMQILTIQVCTAKIYPVQLIPPNLVDSDPIHLVLMYKKYPCTHLYRVATYKMCTAGIHLFAQSPSRTAALRPPYSSPEDQRRRWQCNRFCSNPAWRQSSELGYPG